MLEMPSHQAFRLVPPAGFERAVPSGVVIGC
jgi:hypothetical protein